MCNIGYLSILRKNLNDNAIKILILASILLVAMKLIFEWKRKRVAWIEGTSILIVTLVVTMFSSMTEYSINKRIVNIKLAQQQLIKVIQSSLFL